MSLPSSLRSPIFSCIEMRRAWSCADRRSRIARVGRGRASGAGIDVARGRSCGSSSSTHECLQPKVELE